MLKPEHQESPGVNCYILVGGISQNRTAGDPACKMKEKSEDRRLMLSSRSALLIAALVFVPLPAVADISPGTQLTGNIDKGYSSKDAQVGDSFTLSNVHSTNHDINGAVVYGHIASVTRAGQGTPGKIALDFDKVNTRSGNIYKIVGRATNVKVDTKNNTGTELAAGAGGALVGGLLGRGTGAVIGGGAGLLYAKNSRQNISIPKGSLLTVQVSQARKQSQ
jgi:hypothetical protein